MTWLYSRSALAVLLSGTLFSLPALVSAEGGALWETDYEKAVARAQRESRFVYLNFAGSDWCLPCKRMKREIFDQQAFKDFATENLVLVELDFPVKQLPPELKQKNRSLAEKYSIEAFPTIVLLDPEGDEVGRQEGYQPQALESYLNGVKQMMAGHREAN